MKRFIFAVTAMIMLIAAGNAEARNKPDTKDQKKEAYNKAVALIESGNFILMADKLSYFSSTDPRLNFFMIKNGEGIWQSEFPGGATQRLSYVKYPVRSTKLTKVNDFKIDKRKKGKIVCTVVLQNANIKGNATHEIYLTIKPQSDYASATWAGLVFVEQTSGINPISVSYPPMTMSGKIMSPDDADYNIWPIMEDAK